MTLLELAEHLMEACEQKPMEADREVVLIHLTAETTDIQYCCSTDHHKIMIVGDEDPHVMNLIAQGDKEEQANYVHKENANANSDGQSFDVEVSEAKTE